VCNLFGRTQKGSYKLSRALPAPGAQRSHRACSHLRRRAQIVDVSSHTVGIIAKLKYAPARRPARHARSTRLHVNVNLAFLDCRPKSARTVRFPPSASPLLMPRGRPAVVHGQHPSARRSASTLICCTLCRRSRMRAHVYICTSGNFDTVAVDTACARRDGECDADSASPFKVVFQARLGESSSTFPSYDIPSSSHSPILSATALAHPPASPPTQARSSSTSSPPARQMVFS
jgi:hypothetical protein